jgi:hypothetical protein
MLRLPTERIVQLLAGIVLSGSSKLYTSIMVLNHVQQRTRNAFILLHIEASKPKDRDDVERA